MPFAVPHIDSVTPTTLPPANGGYITIVGKNFGNDKTIITVSLGPHASITVYSVEDQILVAEVGPNSGKNFDVKVTIMGADSNTVSVSYERMCPFMHVTGAYFYRTFHL